MKKQQSAFPMSLMTQMNWPRIRKNARRVWIAVGLSFFAWMLWNFQSHGVDSAVVVSSTTVEVTEENGSWRFIPIERSSSGGLVLLPGGMVDPRAYFPLARALAEEGHPVVVMSLPFRTAPTEASERSVLRAAQEAARRVDPAGAWVLAGHSRGAAIATRLIRRGSEEFAGLALIGTTHPRLDLSDLAMPVLKIGGTHDCVAPRARSEEAAGLLPPSTQWEWIEGANHAQFAWYGSQLNDCEATISREEQQDMLRALLSRFLSSFGPAS